MRRHPTGSLGNGTNTTLTVCLAFFTLYLTLNHGTTSIAAASTTSSTPAPSTTNTSSTVTTATSRNHNDSITTAYDNSTQKKVEWIMTIVVYCVIGSSILSFLVVAFCVLYVSCRKPGRLYGFTDDEVALLLDLDDDDGSQTLLGKNGGGSRRGRIPAASSSHFYQPLDNDFDEDATTAARESMNKDPQNVIYFKKDGTLDTSFVNPNYGKGSPMTIESHSDDDDHIRYYMTVYDELTASEMEEPTHANWQIPKLIKATTTPVTLKEPEYD
ncbi:envelope glycoprotein UL132 [Panine betaherpesvirus 2]|uniref:Envelope glycoprotein UL132 n=1 Tax=Panine betaherpesvirus 2 TaxID=188763 RepID=Q8QRY1_9BETA|nr:envelope glycoprotein UL132 [Panine betaherpesvirus 2]AAM00757.1 envelope glycoprotein UL132 [Panine betaherpesvirus 2]QXV67870.1 envelope glycoprotein UL132 [Panine betaherpesvirus 2]